MFELCVGGFAIPRTQTAVPKPGVAFSSDGEREKGIGVVNEDNERWLPRTSSDGKITFLSTPNLPHTM